MRVFILLLLTLSAATETEAILFDLLQGVVNIATHLVGSVLDWTMTTVNKFVDTAFVVTSRVIGAVVDPFGWWTHDIDEHGHLTEEVKKCSALADIVFVFDTSGSMNNPQFELTKSFAIRLTQHFEIGKNDVLFSAFSFGGEVDKVFDLNSYSDHSALSKALENIPFIGGSTQTYLALDAVKQYAFSSANGARADSSKITIVITDASSDSLAKTNYAATNLASISKVISVGENSGLGVELYNIASDDNNVFRADSYNNLVRIEQWVARRICEIVAADGNIKIIAGETECPAGFKKNPQKPGSCKDINECTEGKSLCEQMCVNMIGGYRCTCIEGFAIDPNDTSKCKRVTECPVFMDIIFVMDFSSSMSKKDLIFQQNFVSRQTRHYMFGPTAARFGALIFSTYPYKLFDLNTYSSISDVIDALNKNTTSFVQGGTNTHLALQYISENEMFSSSSGGRDKALKVVVMLLDGDPSYKDKTEMATRNLISQGGEIFAIAVGGQVALENMLKLVNTPKNVLGTTSFEFIDYLEEPLAQSICSIDETN